MTALAAFRFNARHLAWLPAALLITAGVLSAIGVSLTPTSGAATATGSAVVSASVLPEVSLDLGQDAAGAAGCSAGAGSISGPANAETATFGLDAAGQRLSIAASGSTVLGTCSMTFGTNNGSGGASIAVNNARPSGDIFCTSAQLAACAGSFYTDDDGTNATLEADKFGIQMLAASTCDTQAWTDLRYYGAPDTPGAGANICTGEAANATAANDGVVALSFEVNTSTRPSGNYYAQLDFTATAT